MCVPCVCDKKNNILSEVTEHLKKFRFIFIKKKLKINILLNQILILNKLKVKLLANNLKEQSIFYQMN